MQKIAIIKLSSLGDIIHSIPITYLIKKHINNAEIHWISEIAYHELLSLNKYIDQIHDVRIRKLKKDFSGIFHECKKLLELRKLGFDYSFDLQGNLKSGIVSKLINAKKRIGFSKNVCQEQVNVIFNNKIVNFENDNCHVVNKNIKLLRAINIHDDKDIRFPLEFNAQMLNNAKKMTLGYQGLQRPIFGISLLAGFETKIISIEFWAKILNAVLAEYPNCTLMLFWGPGEKDHTRIIHDRFSKKKPGQVLMLPPTSIIESFYFMDMVDIFIASDTGPLHIADSMGKKVIGIFTSTCPFRTGPYMNMKNSIRSKAVCAPCYRKKCNKTICKNDINIKDIIKLTGRILKNS